MAVMRFDVTPPERITQAMLEWTYAAGYDRVPVATEMARQGGQLHVETTADESAVIHVPWTLPGMSPVLFPTGTLRPREKPYRLPLELARGAVSQLRELETDWRKAGLAIPSVAVERAAAAQRLLRQAILYPEPPGEAASRAEETLLCAEEAGRLLAEAFAEWGRNERRREPQQAVPFLGADLGLTAPPTPVQRQIVEAFNAGNVSLCWAEIEPEEGRFSWEPADRQLAWSRENRLITTVGPLLRFDAAGMPAWVAQLEADRLLVAARRFVEAALIRYRSSVDLWQVASGLAHSDALIPSPLPGPLKLQVAMQAAEIVSGLATEAAVVITIDQPWGESLRREPLGLSPVELSDVLIRADLGLTGLWLNLHLGYAAHGSLPRPLPEVNRQIDYYAAFGVPLYAGLVLPSAAGFDPLARLPAEAVEGWTPARQQEYAGRLARLLLAKPQVQGIVWSQLRDSEPHDLPFGGLYDLRRHPKPVLRTLASTRRAFFR